MSPDLVFVNKRSDKCRADTGAGITCAAVFDVGEVGFDLLEVRVVQRQSPNCLVRSAGRFGKLFYQFIVTTENGGIVIAQCAAC